MSNITALSYLPQEAVLFPSSPNTPYSIDLESDVISAWEGFESGDVITGDETLFSLVQSAIQKQSPGATLNSLNWGPQTGIQYSAGFVAPPQDAAFIGAGGTLNIALFVPGNSLVFTASGAAFDVSFDLNVNLQLTFPSSLAPIWAGAQSDWSVGLSATAQVEAFSVTSHNVVVSLCHRDAVTAVLNEINGKTVSVANITTTGLTFLSGVIAGAGDAGYTQLLQADDGAGTLDLTAVAPNLVINGADNDTIQINTSANGDILVSAHGQSITLLPVFPASQNSITVNLAGGSSVLSIAGLPAGATLNVATQQSGTTNAVIGGAEGLASLTNTVINVSATSGAIALTVDDSGDNSGRTASISDNAVNFTGLTIVNYTGTVTSLKVQGGSGNDQFFVSSVGLPTTVDAGAGNNLVYVGLFSTNPAAAGTGQGSLRQLAGALDVTDATGATSLVIDASGQGYDYFQIYSDHVTFSAGPTINFTPAGWVLVPTGRQDIGRTVVGINYLTIYGNAQGNNIQAASVAPQTTVTVWGSAQDILAGAALGTILHKIYPPGPVPPVRLPVIAPQPPVVAKPQSTA